MKKNRERVIAVRVTEKEREIIRKNAEKQGLNMSTFLRVIGLKS